MGAFKRMQNSTIATSDSAAYNLETLKKMNLLKQWPWVLLLLSVFVAVLTGIPGIRDLDKARENIAWFHISVFSALAFLFVGAAQYVHSALEDLKSHVLDKEKPLGDAIANIQQVANNLRSDVRCEFVGADEAATQYLCNKCHGEELIGIQGTLVRPDDKHSYYLSETYKGIEDSLRMFLSRPDTYLEEVVGPRPDKRLVDAYVNAAGNLEQVEPARVSWYRINEETPILNFLILTFRENGAAERYEEVLFGGSRYANESNEAVFKSRDPRVVQEFKDLYKVLSRSSTKVAAKSLQDQVDWGSSSSMSIHEKWVQARLYARLNTTKPAGQESIKDSGGDLRISTTFFIDYFGLREDVLLALREKGASVKILLMNPDNPALMQARFGLRKDGLGFDRAKGDLLSDMHSLEDFPNIEVRVSDSMPCGFVAHSNEWAVVGLMPAHASYVTGPMIETSSNSRLWSMLHEDWKVRWGAAKHYEPVTPQTNKAKKVG
jgi:hypothetical protein